MRKNFNLGQRSLDRLQAITKAMEATSETETIRKLLSLGESVFVKKEFRIVDEDGRKVMLF